MGDITLYSTSLLFPSDILCNFVQIYSHLTAIVAINNVQQPKKRFCPNQNVPLNNIPSWIMKSNHFIPYNVIGTIQAFQALAKSRSFGFKFVSSLNPTTSINISIIKRCLLLSAFATLLDFPLLCFNINV